MGICISSASSGIYQIHDDGLENVLYYGEKENDGNLNGTGQKHCSLYSKEGSKGVNQDAAFFYQGYGVEDGALCGVFDGHGKNGHIVSKIVRNRLPSLLLNQKNAIAKLKTSGDDYNNEKLPNGEMGPSKSFYKWKQAFTSAYKVMDKEIKLQESLDCSSSGTTAVVVAKEGEHLVIANLGDSRAVLGRSIIENQVFPVELTIDLKPSTPCEADRIRKCNGRVLALKAEPHIHRVWLPYEDSPGLAMSRAFGDFMLKNHGIIALPEVSYHRLTEEDKFIVLATDGVWDVLSNEEVVSCVWSADSEQAAAKAVVDAATAAWEKKFSSAKVDDCTVVCLFFQKNQDFVLIPA